MTDRFFISMWVLVAALVFACDDNSPESIPAIPDPAPSLDAVQIRVENNSSFDFADLLVNTGGGAQDYGELKRDTESVYKTFDFAYRYASIILKIDGEEFRLTPYDYVGEEKLAFGRYTYVISVEESSVGDRNLSLSLQKD